MIEDDIINDDFSDVGSTGSSDNVSDVSSSLCDEQSAQLASSSTSTVIIRTFTIRAAFSEM